MIVGDYKIQLEPFIGCKCGRNHEKLNRQSTQKVFRYRGYKGIVRFFHDDNILPTEDVTHFVTGNAIVGLNLSDRFYIVSKHIMDYERLLFVSNTTDDEYLSFCRDFWREIKE